MKRLNKVSNAWLASCTLLLLVSFACTEAPTDPEAPLLAKPAALDEVEVAATEPDSAVQDTTVVVDVLGDGFDDGSDVEFLIDDAVAEKLKVKNVHYVNKKKLEVELEVDSVAEVRLYDVRVTTKRGPRGVGTELFRVTERVKDKPEAVTITSFEIEQVAPTAAPDDRCPDPENTCFKLTAGYTGTLDSARFWVRHLYEEYFDTTIEEYDRAAGMWNRGGTDVFMPNIQGTFTAFWQGQWMPVWAPNPDDLVYLPAETFVDFAPLGEPDAFTFFLAYADVNGTHSKTFPVEEYPTSVVYFQGQEPLGPTFAKLDDIEIVTTGRNKNFLETNLYFNLYSFLSRTEQTMSTSTYATRRVLVTHPDGSRIILSEVGGGDPPDDLYYSRFKTEAPSIGCYEIRVIGMDYLAGTGPEYIDNRFYVWDPVQDPEGAAPVGVDYDGETVTTIPGGCSQLPQQP